MTETLGQKEERFARALGEFLVWIYSDPRRAVRRGEWLRSQTVAEQNAVLHKGIVRSLHLDGLAVDLPLFIDGVYQRDSEAYAELGAKWKSMGPDHRWGGDFKDKFGHPDPDGNHFSIEHEGRK